MLAYLTRRLLLVIPTLFGILLINFAVIQALPGGPVQRIISELSGRGVGATARVTGGGNEAMGGGGSEQAGGGAGRYRGAQGLDPAFIADLERQFGFDQPAWRRFVIMVRRLSARSISATASSATARWRDLVVDKMPVSISLGLWTTLLTYLISIPLGIRKAVRDGTPFDVWTSGVIVVGYAIPSFLFAVLLIVLFAGGSYWQVFPLRGLVSENFWSLPWYAKVLDYLWHMVLPVAAMLIGSFATLTMLTKNSFIEEINKQYVLTARAKGLDERRGPVRARLPQRDADRDRGLPGGVRLGPVHRLAADRGDLLPRRVGPARLRGRPQPRLPGDAGHALRLHPVRPAA